MRKRTVNFIALATIIGVIVIWFVLTFSPKKLVDENDYIVGLRVTYNGSEIQTDQDKIIKILSKYHSIISFKDYFPYETRKINFEIDFIDNNKPVHILLGEFNVWSKSAGGHVYEIQDAQQLKQELKDALNLK